jgi:hypothetical protein
VRNMRVLGDEIVHHLHDVLVDSPLGIGEIAMRVDAADIIPIENLTRIHESAAVALAVQVCIDHFFELKPSFFQVSFGMRRIKFLHSCPHLIQKVTVIIYFFASIKFMERRYVRNESTLSSRSSASKWKSSSRGRRSYCRRGCNGIVWFCFLFGRGATWRAVRSIDSIKNRLNAIVSSKQLFSLGS